jgi:hypothetical protein
LEIHKRAGGFNSLGTAHAEIAMSRANLARFAESVRPLCPPWAAIPGNAAARLMFVFFAFFTPAITPPFAARLSDTEPTLGARSKTAPASPFRPFATVTVLAFAGFSMRFAHGIAVSQSGEASSKRQGDGQRIQKKSYENNK